MDQEIIARVEHGSRARWWRRIGTKRSGFRYVDHTGMAITKPDAIARIKSLVIPPAWRHVRIAPGGRSNIQAVGVDVAGRVQYLYSQAFTSKRATQKFDKIIAFGEALPQLRRITNEHVGSETFSKHRVIAVMIRLINDLYFRVGSEKSVDKHKTYGITTLRNRHLEIQPRGKLVFNFVGKHHIRHRVISVDPELASAAREIKGLRGSRLFSFVDQSGSIRPVTGRDINQYIRLHTGSNGKPSNLTAKDFRTWGATLLAAIALSQIESAHSTSQLKRNLLKVLRQVSERLGNTVAVCRSSYVHPAVFRAYELGETIAEREKRAMRRELRAQEDPREIALIQLLKKYRKL